MQTCEALKQLVGNAAQVLCKIGREESVPSGAMKGLRKGAFFLGYQCLRCLPRQMLLRKDGTSKETLPKSSRKSPQPLFLPGHMFMEGTKTEN